MAERRRGLSLGTRIFLVTGLLLVLALGVAIIVTSYLGNRIGLATATERILASNSVQSVSQQQRYQQLSLLTQILTADPELKAYLLRAIDERDQLSMLDQLDERQADLGYDFALMVDPQGQLLVRTDQPDAPPVDLSARPLVRKVLADFEASGVWQEGNKIYEAVAVPLTLSQNVFAYLVVGFAINDVRALEVKRVTGTEVAYLTGTSTGVAVVASTLAPAQQDRLLAALRTRGDLLSRVTERGQAVDQVEIALEGGALAGAARAAQGCDGSLGGSLRGARLARQGARRLHPDPQHPRRARPGDHRRRADHLLPALAPRVQAGAPAGRGGDRRSVGQLRGADADRRSGRGRGPRDRLQHPAHRSARAPRHGGLRLGAVAQPAGAGGAW